MVRIRNYQPSDSKALWEIYFHTVRNINVRDYSQEQVEAWAPSDFDSELWDKCLRRIQPFVAELDGRVVGYTDLQPNGLIDHFFCHHEYQGKGVGKALMEHVFTVVNEQEVEMRGVKLTNYVMEKIVEDGQGS